MNKTEFKKAYRFIRTETGRDTQPDQLTPDQRIALKCNLAFWKAAYKESPYNNGLLFCGTINKADRTLVICGRAMPLFIY